MGLSRRVHRAEKAPVLAPTPSARVRMADAANPGEWPSVRSVFSMASAVEVEGVAVGIAERGCIDLYWASRRNCRVFGRRARVETPTQVPDSSSPQCIAELEIQGLGGMPVERDRRQYDAGPAFQSGTLRRQNGSFHPRTV